MRGPVVALLFVAGCGEPPAGPAGREPGPAQADDRDGDGYAADDCDDLDASVHPGVELDPCNDTDDDCDGEVDEDADRYWYLDADDDGYGAGEPEGPACEGGEGTVANALDCDDADATSWPGADEACDQADNDCDGTVDEGLTGSAVYYADADGDGSGDPEATTDACAMPEGYVENAWDCDDADDAEPRWADASAGRGGDGTMTDPYDTIQEAIDAASACVRVRGGNYAESLAVDGRAIDIVGVDGSDETVVTAEAESPVLTVKDSPGLSLSGMELTGGGGYAETDVGASYTSTSWYGGGLVAVDASVTLEDVVFSSNSLPDYSYECDASGCAYVSSVGGGIFASGGSLTLTDVDLRGNSAYQVGAMYVANADVVMTRVRLLGNSAEYYAGTYLVSSTLDAQNLIVNANKASGQYEGILLYEVAATLDHATIVDVDYGIVAAGSRALTLRNSIVAGEVVGVASEREPTAAYNDVWGAATDWSGIDDPTGSDGNISEDPAFVTWKRDSSWSNDNLALDEGSPCVDAGDPEELDTDGTVSDVGAYGGPNGGW
jgi:hypothetical protein